MADIALRLFCSPGLCRGLVGHRRGLFGTFFCDRYGLFAHRGGPVANRGCGFRALGKLLAALDSFFDQLCALGGLSKHANYRNRSSSGQGRFPVLALRNGDPSAGEIGCRPNHGKETRHIQSGLRRLQNPAIVPCVVRRGRLRSCACGTGIVRGLRASDLSLRKPVEDTAIFIGARPGLIVLGRARETV